MKIKDYNSILPIRSIEGEDVLNSDNIISVSFKITYPEVFLSKKEWYNETQNKLISTLKLFPNNTIFQTLSFFDEELYEGDFDTATNYLERNKQLYYDQRPIPTQQEYIIITFSDKPLKKGFNNHVLKNNCKIWDNEYKQSLDYIEKIEIEKQTAKSKIETAYTGCRVEQLTNRQHISLLYKYLSQDYNGVNKKDYKLPEANFEQNKIGDSHIGLISMYQGRKTLSFQPHKITKPYITKKENRNLPQTFGNIDQGSMFPVMIGLPFPHIVSCIIQKLEVNKVLFDMDMELRSVNFPATLGIPIAKKKKTTLEAFSDMFSNGDFYPCYLSMSLIIKDKDKKLLNKKLDITKGVIAKINDMNGIIEDAEIPYLFLSNCPYNANQQYKRDLTTLTNAVSFLPKESHYLSDKKGFLFCDRFGKPMLIDILNYRGMTNKNGMIIGPSGRGKSYTLNYLVSLLYSGSHLMIIDKGGSYLKLCQLFGGKYYDSAKQEDFSFSLFECEKNHLGHYIPDGIHINFILAICIFIWKENKAPTPEEKTILKEFIEIYYNHVNAEKERPTLSGFVSYIIENWDNMHHHFEKIAYHDYFDIGSFSLLMRPYTTGNEKELFNSNEQIDLTYENFVYFDMKNMEKSDKMKFNLVCILITFLNIKKLQKLPRKIFKSFIIDEALSFLKGDIGEFIGNLFAEVRKENGQVLIVAQGISFITEASKEVQKKIFANRDFICMTNHSGYENEFGEYKKLLGFNEKDISLLNSVVMHSEIFLRLGNNPMVLKIDCSPYEDAAFTMDEKELPILEKLHREHGSIHTAIETFASLKTKKQ